MKSPIVLLESLLNDFERLNPGVKGLDRDLITIKKRFENEGFGFLAKALPALDEALLLGLSTHRFTCPIGFKLTKGGAIPRLFSGMLCEVFDPFTGILKDSPDMGILKCLHGILRIFKKTQVSEEDEDILHQKAVNEFYQCDERASRVIIPDRHDHLIGRVCKLILNSLNSKEVENAIYKHGPGAVFEGYKANEKFSALWHAVRSDERVLHSSGLWGLDENRDNPWARGPLPNPGLFSSDAGSTNGEALGVTGKSPGASARGEEVSRRHLRSRATLPGNKGDTSEVYRASRGIARLISVPKNSTSRRTITVEPMLYQFVQQGLNILLRDSISECGILSNSIALSDQSKNQELALEGSLYDNWATIDLKSASDLLSVSLVKSVFRHNAQFLEHMMECRSPFVECSGKPLLHLGKFAGMGNALTFPVQSICFAVVCIAAILDTKGQTPTYWRVKRASRHIRVYGDDIIVSKRYAHQCVAWLHDVGLQVNTKKSFLSGNFKESCGVEAFRGVDITPLYLKHHPVQTSFSPSVIEGYVALSNHMWMEGLYAASNWMREIVEDSLGRVLPLVSCTSGLLGWFSRQDSMSPHKWCRRTQQFLTRSVVVESIKRFDKLDGYPALLKCLLADPDRLTVEQLEDYHKGGQEFQKSLIPRPLARDSDHLSKTSIRYKGRIKTRWVPTLVGAVLNPVM
jgi:hypothetical protein